MTIGRAATGTAAVWSGDEFTISSMALPELIGDELLVEVELATICGSDLHTVEGRRSTPVPTVLGHEAVGRIIEAGPESRWQAGDRVVWTIGTSCGSCRACNRGLTQKCEAVRKYGHERMTPQWSFNGSLASHIHLVSGTGVVSVPDDLPAAALAPAGCATATVTGAARRVGMSADDAVVVIGCGMLGLTAVAYARHIGVASIVACDIDDARRDAAKSLGAGFTCAPDELGPVAEAQGADVVIELSGHPDAVRLAIEIAGVGGRVALVGSVSPGPPVAIDPESIVRRLVSVVGSHNYAHCDLLAAVEFLTTTKAAGMLAALVTEPVPLSAIDDAISLASSRAAPRVAVRPSA